MDHDSIPSRALLKAKSSAIILSSAPVLVELIEVIARPKFDKYVSLEIRLAFVQEYELLCEMVTVTHQVNACRDPKDNIYLELALSGNADCIVSGDPDLLVLNPFQGISIISPRHFLERG